MLACMVTGSTIQAGLRGFVASNRLFMQVYAIPYIVVALRHGLSLVYRGFVVVIGMVIVCRL